MEIYKKATNGLKGDDKEVWPSVYEYQVWLDNMNGEDKPSNNKLVSMKMASGYWMERDDKAQ